MMEAIEACFASNCEPGCGGSSALIQRMRADWANVCRSLAIAYLTLLVGCSRPEPLQSGLEVRELPIGGNPGALALPAARSSVKFAVIGDSGRGWRPQHEVAARMAEYRVRFPFSFVLMAGDNIYEGPASAEDYRLKFEEPYRALLDAGVRFYAVLGNHDDPRQRFYAPFNMGGQRYYTFRPPSGLLARIAEDVQVFAFDSTNLDGAQVAWARRELGRSHARWKIVLLHHPVYSPGRYRAQARLTRWQIESTLVDGHVDAVFSGHEHLFARMKPQQGVQYFISGAAGSLRKGDVRAVASLARSFDDDLHFMLVEIDGDAMYVQAISRLGRTVDAAVLEKRPHVTAPGMAGPH
jgi:predicted phosphodiesterase